MKRAFSLLFIALLVTSCAAIGTTKVTRTDTLDENWAYVTGKYGASHKPLVFALNGEAGFLDESSRFALKDDNDYHVRKVKPGRYWFTSAPIGDNKKLEKGGEALGTVDLEAGKVTYVGDISFSWPTGSSGKHPDDVPSKLVVRGDSMKVKNMIKDRYPDFAQNLDKTFVYKPVR
ncbi:hypothetical protein LJC09_01330 [Desulfovibrio sp. OttesenSCG-928-F20]|nr:hypothetical protein [Desulfovibrio sp. OttesenSCG-928-F20]